MELEIIKNSIHEIRGKKVMLDMDLAIIYELETRVLKQAVRRNIEQCIALLDKVTLLPELVGLNAYEIYRQLFEKDPQKCTKCKHGKLYPISAKEPVPT